MDSREITDERARNLALLGELERELRFSIEPGNPRDEPHEKAYRALVTELITAGDDDFKRWLYETSQREDEIAIGACLIKLLNPNY